MLTRLFPTPTKEVELEGIYLDHRVRASAVERPFVYTNFIQSLDGRISEVDPASGRHQVPEAIANANDWRLYMELLAQADVLLTTSRHLSAVAAGRQGELLRLAEDQHPDLVAWRRAQRLPAAPVCAAISRRLQLPVDALRDQYAGHLLVVTVDEAPTARVQALERSGVDVISAGPGGQVDGEVLIQQLAEQGYRSIYSIAGPGVLHILLKARMLDRLYLTVAHRILGGLEYDTLGDGPAYEPPAGFQLKCLYLDRPTPADQGQMFMSFDRAA